MVYIVPPGLYEDTGSYILQNPHHYFSSFSYRKNDLTIVVTLDTDMTFFQKYSPRNKKNVPRTSFISSDWT